MRTTNVVRLSCGFAVALHLTVARNAYAEPEQEAPPAGERAPSPETPPALDTPPPEAPRPVKKEGIRFRIAAAGGLAYGSVLSVGSRGYAIDAAAVLRPSEHLGATVGLAVDLGETEWKLRTREYAAYGTIEAIIGRLRLGAGPQLSFFWMERAPSSIASSVDAIGIGVRARITFDVLAFDGDRALFVSAIPVVEVMRGTTSFLHWDKGAAVAWRVAPTVGVRF
jgi:hypothetical protein